MANDGKDGNGLQKEDNLKNTKFAFSRLARWTPLQEWNSFEELPLIIELED